MRVLHTSDWHIGRTFHGAPTHEFLWEVLNSLAGKVRENDIDVVLVAGDVFDSSIPKPAYLRVYQDAIRSIIDAGAKVVVSSGNHDSPQRLGLNAEWAEAAGLFVRVDPLKAWNPIALDDVDFYAIPYLEPALVRDSFPDDDVSSHEKALRAVLQRIRDEKQRRLRPAVVMAHAFVAAISEDLTEDTEGLERDITRGGLDIVPLTVFDDIDYVALGHIHSRKTLSEQVRYSGAPLYYSFKESSPHRGGWLFDIDSSGLRSVEWLDFPIPRPISSVEGTLSDLLTESRFESVRDHWVRALLTDTVAPIDPLPKLQERFPFCVTLERRPIGQVEGDHASYRQRVEGKGPIDIVNEFLLHVRPDGKGLSDYEREIAVDGFDTLREHEVAR
jgi:exonuclease SbcD